ncbi:hypothetical protein, partial [Vibrio sp. 2132-1]|uniref:hypothetical protein n=1 Tax=Vibrio sp. 2132-1 TaxID=3074598 RepID=UPI002966C1C0
QPVSAIATDAASKLILFILNLPFSRVSYLLFSITKTNTKVYFLINESLLGLWLGEIKTRKTA